MPSDLDRPMPATAPPLRATPLHALHESLGARIVPFAGWMLPVSYPAGTLAEHRACRETAALFDVSHMGQLDLPLDAAAGVETLVVGDIAALRPGRQRYTLLTNAAGGIIDDLMVMALPDRLRLVVNASRADHDTDHIATALGDAQRPVRRDDLALLALQGPGAEAALAAICPAAPAMRFMDVIQAEAAGVPVTLSRSGYTGEDGFEISVAAADAEPLARALLAQPGVQPAGLGARDSLRLEAGLPLYGHDIDELTSPVEAGLTWSVGKRRRMAWDFPGAAVVRDQLDNGAPRLRVGLLPDGRAPARAGTSIVAPDGTGAGTVTSGTFGATRDAPVAMGYVRRDLATDGTELLLMLRGKPVPARVAPLPFVPHRFRH